MRTRFHWLRPLLTVALAFGVAAGSAAQTTPPAFNGAADGFQPRDAAKGAVVLPPSVPDPLEPVNRALYSFDTGIMTGVIKPTERGYRFIVRKPVRTGIANVNRNVVYPGRLINNLLQAKWSGAWNETEAFFCNTFVGVGGLADVATRWNIPRSDADFGQTFGYWGWKPACYLMLPFYGPSNERDLAGLVSDTLANPLIYLTSYPLTLHDPVIHTSPYTYFAEGAMYNSFADTVDADVRFKRAEKDAYSEIQFEWSFARALRAPDFTLKGKQDPATLETLQSVFFTFKELEFPNRGVTRSVMIPATGRRLKFTYWLQPAAAPVVYIVPGLGSHRLATSALALAELVFRHGFSAVTVSSPYNYEFMEQASSAALPAYTPVDARDLHAALTGIDRQLEEVHPGRLGERALLGYSMGAFQSLFVAAGPSAGRGPGMKFDRYVAIDTPVRLLYGLSKLDEFYDAPLAWPAAERTSDLKNTLEKVAALSKIAPDPKTPPPFDAVESKFLIGLTFRFVLRDVIYSSQERNSQGILKHPFNPLRRAPLLHEILHYSYRDYFEKFATPSYLARGINLADPKTRAKAGDLRSHAAALRANDDIRIIVNRDDFLLPGEDLQWLQATFKPGHLTVFDHGGHLGNLGDPAVQSAILAALEDLKPIPAKAR